jgi:carbamoyltransferase
MSSYILGTHTSHNGSACILKDGKILVAIEKERITREKHAGGADDRAAINYCLNVAGIGIDDLDLVVQNDNFHNFEYPQSKERFADARRVVTISHHLAHAYSAIGTSPFDDANVLIIDGCGSPFSRCLDLEGGIYPEQPQSGYEHLLCEKDSFYSFDGNEITSVYKDFSVLQDFGQPLIAPKTTMHSIGGAYLGVSVYVFRGLDDVGKLMGLAPYGRPGRVNEQLFDLRDGRVFVNYDWMQNFDRPARGYTEFKENFQYYADIAFWAQREIERALLYVIRHRYELNPSPRLCYAGGVALNAVANRLIQTDTPYENVYFQPAAGDNGIAIGCAYYGWMSVLGNSRVRHSGSTCFGKKYNSVEILESLERNDRLIEFEKSDDIVASTASDLVKGKVVAWFQGGSEFGPRALGHRSILALPDRVELRNFINLKIKFREDFRPFAPSVPVEDVTRYFDQDYDSPYMILVSQVKDEWRDRIPAVVHVDQSARVQTVHSNLSPRYYQLHRKVDELQGTSVLLNTSFNRRGMPIVETPQQAVEMLLETALDVLVIGDFRIVRRELAESQMPIEINEMLGVAEKRLHASTSSLHGHIVAIQLTELEGALCIDFRGQTLETRHV